MDISKEQIKITKGVAILFMLLLHLFCTKTYEGLFTPSIFIGNTPLIYYFALFGDCCVAIYCFCSGYGLFLSYENNNTNYNKNNRIRILKLYINTWIVLFLLLPVIGWIIYLIYKIMMKFELAMSFGHGVGFGIGVWLLNPIFESIIAFSKNEYITEKIN